MTEPVVSKPSKFRFASFAVVLLLVSGLVVALFDEARAANIDITVSGSTIFADIVIPDGQKMPLASVTAVIETNPTGAATKTASDRPVIRAIQQCDAPVVGCPTPIPFDAQETVGTAITAIAFDNIYVNNVASGYTVDARGLAQGAYFSACQCDLTLAGGYGYEVGAGYGYGGVVGETPGPEAGGFGYGYDGDDLILRFQVTINPSALTANTPHWFTFFADTGSGTLGELSSVATSFTPGGGGGGGGGGGTGGTGGGGAGGAITLTAGPVTPPTGALAAFQVTGVTQTAGNLITINTGSDFFPTIEFTPSSDLNGATIDMVHYPPDSPPDTVGNLPPGLEVVGFLQITVSSGGTSHTITVAITIPPGQAEGKDPTKAVFLKWSEGDAKWISKGRITLTENADGSLSGEATSDCCSDYAVAFDEEDPDVTLTVPSGDLTGPQTVTAEASDNLEVAKVEFYVDDTLVNTDTSAPYSYSLNTALFPNGDHTIRAVAYDVVDNTAESTATSSFDNEDAPPGPGDGGPGDGDGDGLPWGTILIVLVVLAIIGFAGYYFYPQSQKK